MLKNIQILKPFLSSRVENLGQATWPPNDLSVQKDSFEYVITETLISMKNIKEARKEFEFIRNKTQMNDLQYIKILNLTNRYFESLNEILELIS